MGYRIQCHSILLKVKILYGSLEPRLALKLTLSFLIIYCYHLTFSYLLMIFALSEASQQVPNPVCMKGACMRVYVCRYGSYRAHINFYFLCYASARMQGLEYAKHILFDNTLYHASSLFGVCLLTVPRISILLVVGAAGSGWSTNSVALPYSRNSQ